MTPSTDIAAALRRGMKRAQERPGDHHNDWFFLIGVVQAVDPELGKELSDFNIRTNEAIAAYWKSQAAPIPHDPWAERDRIALDRQIRAGGHDYAY